jgi:hypothetical protein
MPRRCPEFEPGEAGVETAKLEKVIFEIRDFFLPILTKN